MARRVSIGGEVSAEDVRDRARRLGLLGWVRLIDEGTLCAHVEGDSASVEEFLCAADLASESPARAEGHEQFAIRGAPAGTFVVQEHQARAHHFA